MASSQLAQRKSRLEPPRRQEREGLPFFLPFAPFAPSRFKSPEPPERAVHKAGANIRMHECARPGGARKSRLEPPRRQEREGLLFLFPLRPLRLCGSNLRNRQSGPSTKRARIRECTNSPGPVAQVSNLQKIAVGTAKTPRARRSSFSLSFAPFAPLRFKSPEPPERAVHEAGANTRMHEYARPGGASFQPAQRKSRLKPPPAGRWPTAQSTNLTGKPRPCWPM